jgi:hypothetical protein
MGLLPAPVLSRHPARTPLFPLASLLSGGWRVVLTARLLLPQAVAFASGVLEELRHRL